MVNKSDIHI